MIIVLNYFIQLNNNNNNNNSSGNDNYNNSIELLNDNNIKRIDVIS